MIRSVLLPFILLVIPFGVFAQGEAGVKGGAPSDKKSIQYHRSYFNAIKQFHAGNYENAKELVEKCQKLKGGQSSLYYLRAQIAEKEGDKPNYVLYAEKAFTAADTNNDLLDYYVKALAKTRNWKKAASTIEAFLNDQTVSDKRYVFLSKSLAKYQVRDNQINRAVSTYEGLVEKYGQREDFLQDLKRLYEYKADTEALKEVLAQLMELKPSKAIYAVDLAEIYYQAGERKQAIVTLEDWKKRGNSSALADLHLGKFYFQTGEKDKGRSLLMAAVSKSALPVKKTVGLLRGLWNASPVEEADLAIARKLADTRQGNIQANLLCGEVLAGEQIWLESSDYFSKAYELNENDFAILGQLLDNLYKGHQYEKLKKQSSEALETFPNQPLPYLYNGLALLETKAYDECLDVLNGGRAMVINNQNLAKQFELSMADCEHYMGNHSASDSRFNKMLAKNPNDATVLNNYAYFLSLREERLADAQKMSKRSLELEPGNAVFLDTYGWILFKQEKYADAVEVLERSVKLADDIGEIHHHLGDAHAKAGDMDKALKHWKTARELGEDSAILQKKISNKHYYEK